MSHLLVVYGMTRKMADEPLAVEKYVEIFSEEVNIYPVGIVINPCAYWIGASPDRKVYNPYRQPHIGNLEVKCPRVSSVLEVPYLERHNNTLKLRRNYIYYSQVFKTQLAVTGVEWCDFFVWFNNNYHLETIAFDAVAWQEIKDKADQFFFDYYL